MDPRQLMQTLTQITQEGEAIVQQLTASGVPQEAIMAALSGQQPQQPGMGAGRGPDVPPGMPPGMGGGRGPDLPPPSQANAGIQATNAAMGRGGGAPQGLLGGR